MNRCVTQLTPVSWYSNAVSRVVGLRFRALRAYRCLDLLASLYVFRARQDWEPAEIGDQANSSESGAPEGLILIAFRLKSLGLNINLTMWLRLRFASYRVALLLR